VNTNLICNTPTSCNSALPYAPPSGTNATFRYTLRSDMFFHDGKQVTSFDVAFSYLSLLATGAFQSSGSSPIIAITVLSPVQFDFNVNSIGPTTAFTLAWPLVMPGRLLDWNVSEQLGLGHHELQLGLLLLPGTVQHQFCHYRLKRTPTVVCDIGAGLTIVHSQQPT